jgi:HEAT repeat protein
MNRLILLSLISAISVLCQSEDKAAWDIIKKGLAEKSADNRVKAAHVLGLIENDSEAQSTAEKLLADPEPKVRASAARALGKMGAKSSIPKLRPLVKDHESEVVFAVAGALTKLGDSKAYEIYYAALTGERKSGESLAEEQMKMLKDPKALAKIGFEQGIGFIPFAGMGLTAFKMATKDDSSPVRAAAAQQLARDPDPRAAKALVEALSDKKWLVRASAADAIGQRNDPSLMRSLTPAFKDSNHTVALTAAAAYLRLNAKARSHGRS